MVENKKKIKVFYNDLENHVTCSEGILVEQTDSLITIISFEKIVSIPLAKVVRIEEEK